MIAKNLLEERKRKPTFSRQNTGLKSRLSPKWRRPKGLQSKLRLRRKNRGVYVSPGYQSAKAIRGLTRAGLLPIRINSVEKLAKLDAKKHAIVIPATLGFKKQKDIIEAALKVNLVIENFKNPKEYLEKKLAELKAKKESKEEKTKKKKAEEKKAQEKAAKKKAEKPAPKPVEETKEKEEEIVKKKVLTKKQ